MKQRSNMGGEKNKKEEVSQQQSKSCFVIMPISDADGYTPNHFDRVYNYIIKPACEKAGFVANRADKNTKTNYIVIDILRQIVNSDMAICDLSSRNSNVFFELGLRQAFNLKTVLIKDRKTPRSFDISGLRCIDYDESLRVDTVQEIIDKISSALRDTMDGKEEEVNSLIQLLAVDAAKIPDKVKISEDTGMILSEIQRLREDMMSSRTITTYNVRPNSLRFLQALPKFELPNGEICEQNAKLYVKDDDQPFYDEFGSVIDRKQDVTLVRKDGRIKSIADSDGIWDKLTIKESVF